jgi:hypothetical protein
VDVRVKMEWMPEERVWDAVISLSGAVFMDARWKGLGSPSSSPSSEESLEESLSSFFSLEGSVVDAAVASELFLFSGSLDLSSSARSAS